MVNKLCLFLNVLTTIQMIFKNRGIKKMKIFSSLTQINSYFISESSFGIIFQNIFVTGFSLQRNKNCLSLWLLIIVQSDWALCAIEQRSRLEPFMYTPQPYLFGLYVLLNKEADWTLSCTHLNHIYFGSMCYWTNKQIGPFHLQTSTYLFGRYVLLNK